jgi:hypothetical protein
MFNLSRVFITKIKNGHRYKNSWRKKVFLS